MANKIKTKRRVLKIADIDERQDLYPRNNYNWQTAYDYQVSMKAGANFPPVVVTIQKGKFMLVDGKHRLEALKKNKETHVEAEILKPMSDKQIYIEAIKRNITHGRIFSPQEKADICVRLKDLKISTAMIAKIVNIPASKIQGFVADRISFTTQGEAFAVKKPLRHLSGKTVKSDTPLVQIPFQGNSQVGIIDELTALIEENLIDFKDKVVIARLKYLKKILNKIV